MVLISLRHLFFIQTFLNRLCASGKKRNDERALSYEASDKNESDLREKIVDLSSDNPKWIMMVTQTYSILSARALASKFIF